MSNLDLEVSSSSRKWIFGTMLFFGVLGLLASWSLSVERVQQLTDSNANLICNFNPLFNCGTVMKTWQAKVFGFPNSFIGQMAYSVVITLAMAGLARAKFSRWFLITAQVCYGLGLIFAYWLFFQSVFVIQVLCPWCLVVTFSTTVLFETLLRFNLLQNTFGFSEKTQNAVMRFLKKDYDKFAVAAWIALMILLVFVKFQNSLL